ncbi:anti-repressor SinI family protein [Cytobacillus sp. FSL R5-0569]
MKLDKEWVELIKEAKEIGITIDEITELLKEGKPLD